MSERLKLAGMRDEAAYFVIFNVTNVLNYVYLVLAGFLMGAESYGLFGALFGLVYLASALGNMVKMAVARHVATVHAQNGGRVTLDDIKYSLLWPAGFAAVAGLVSLAAVPALMAVFDSSAAPLLWACAAIALSVWAPGSQGVLQGLRRFTALGGVLLLGSVFRIALGVGLVAAGGGVSGAMAGIAFGFALSGVVGLVLCLREADLTTPKTARAKHAKLEAGSMFTALVAAILIATPTSLDVAVVRYLFGGEDAGVYTGIAVLGRVIIFAAVSVPFTLLPKVAARVASGEDPRALLWPSLGITAAIAGLAAFSILLAGDVLGLQLVGTDVSSASAALHWYLAAMVVFSLTMTVIYYQIGNGDRAFILLVAAPGVALQMALIMLIPDSLTGVAQILFGGNIALLVIGLLFGSRALQHGSLGQETNAALRSGVLKPSK